MTDPTDIRALLDALLTDLPADEAEYRARLGAHSPREVSEALVSRLESGTPTREERTAASHLLPFGRSDALDERLRALALDATRPRLVRASALIALAEQASMLFERLSPEDITLPAEAGVEELLALGVEHEEAMAELVKVVAEVPERARPFLLQSVLRMREVHGLPIEFVAAPLLDTRGLESARDTLLEALAQDAGAWGADELLRRTKRPGSTVAKAYERTAARIRERLAHTPAPADTRAWVVPSDGSGTFQFLVTSGTERVTLALVLAHVTDGVVDGAYYPNLTPDDVDEILGGMRSQNVMPLVDVPVGQVAERLAASTATPEALEWQARLAIAFILQHRPEPVSRPEPAPTLEREALARLLERAEYRAWLIEPALLPALPPEAGPERDRWRTDMMQTFEGPERDVLRLMAEHSAWVHALAGETDEARTLVSAARELDVAPDRSLLLELILDATAKAIYELDCDDEPDDEAS